MEEGVTKRPQKRVDRRVARTKQAVHDALARLVEHQDYRKITVTALAREANIDRKTFYLHYNSVDDVVKDAIHEVAQTLAEKLAAIPLVKDGSANIAELYATLGSALLPELLPTKEIALHVPTELILESTQKELITLLSNDENSSFKDLGPLLEFCVSYVVSGAFSVYRRWLLTNSEVPLEDLTALTARLAFKGMGEVMNEAGTIACSSTK